MPKSRFVATDSLSAIGRHRTQRTSFFSVQSVSSQRGGFFLSHIRGGSRESSLYCDLSNVGWHRRWRFRCSSDSRSIEFCALLVFWTISVSILSPAARPAGIALINTVGIGGGSALSPLVIGYFKDLTGSFSSGLLYVIAMLIMSII